MSTRQNPSEGRSFEILLEFSVMRFLGPKQESIDGYCTGTGTATGDYIAPDLELRIPACAIPTTRDPGFILNFE
eukprot:COSAG02_NODE_1229_length_13775_cov_35.321512_2_plen_74_part_00